MVRGLKERLGRKFDEEIRFFRGWQRDKKGVGALVPTSAVTARRMASVIDPSSGLPVLEVQIRAIAERSEYLRELERTLGDRRDETFDCVISAVPMLSFPLERRVALLKDLLARIPRGRPVIQITHGPMSPLPSMPDVYTISHFDFVVRNIPPAQLWLYRSV